MFKRVLIVDDNALNLKLARVLLTGEGFEVREAVDAEDALVLMDEFEPRVVLMDVQLPGMDGLELTRLLKADPRFRQTVILAVTAYAMEGDAQKAFAAGCDGYIAKPIDTLTLAAMLSEYFTNEPRIE